MNAKKREVKEMSLGIAVLPIICLLICMGVTVVVYGEDPQVPLVVSAIFTALLGAKMGHTWRDMESVIIRAIGNLIQTVLILTIVGMLIAIWIMCGTVPTMIYYGLKILNPSIFLVASCVMCCIVSLATGSSWTTAATVGVALIGVGTGLGVPQAMSAGCIISGAYFGDKMSPLSDTTNLAPAIAGANLFDHIRHMVYTTGPSLIIALILYGVLGSRYSAQDLDYTQIEGILTTLSSNFNINLFLFIPPILVIAIVVLKIPAIPGMISGVVLGCVFYVLFQAPPGGFHEALGNIIHGLNNGYVSETGNAMVDELLTRGGIQAMGWTISLIFCALTYGGLLERIGSLEVIATTLLKIAKSVGSLVALTVLSCIFTNFLTGDQYLSIMLPGKMFKDAFRRKGLASKNLSRCLEDGGTLSSPLFPWNACGAFMGGTLGVHSFVYLPYCFLNLINPIVSIVYGFLGITMAKLSAEELEESPNPLPEQ